MKAYERTKEELTEIQNELEARDLVNSAKREIIDILTKELEAQCDIAETSEYAKKRLPYYAALVSVIAREII